ncbi:DUF4136 domain-containing protein [Formosa sp. PL04]|uniref:DUF4136 domain-containing protein n=1 Tax=Formosa sp. PL04 TaxID=3081755 RepID=UPI002981151C|nr:DUF4136 domain-containing protein [Formosa sp. PL04]MDW5288921.1 DUF4136 domain-containing protein [Formosa sp. PL04]
MTLFVTTATIAQVKSDFDKSVDFSKYKTYSIEGWEKDSDKAINSFDKERITTAIESEFSSRGITLVATGGDAAITLYIVIDNKSSTTAYTSFNGGLGYGGGWGWGYRGMAMGGMGMGGTATTTYSQDDYQQGTFVVDMYDATSKKLLWQGVITSVVKENPKKREKSIPKKISKMFADYPIKPLK